MRQMVRRHGHPTTFVLPYPYVMPSWEANGPCHLVFCSTGCGWIFSCQIRRTTDLIQPVSIIAIVGDALLAAAWEGEQVGSVA